MPEDITEKMERAFAELPSVRMGPYYSRLHHSYNHGDFLRSIIPPNILSALHQARKSQELAVSYRDFKVGAAVVALNSSMAGFQIMPGINAKTNEDGPLNMHAESLAIRTAIANKADMISVVAVVGETQNDQQSGNHMHTLHPCGLCRAKLHDSPLVDNDATLIVSALPSLRTIEVSTVNNLMAYHRDDDPDKSGVVLFEYPDLEIFKPYTPPEDGIIRLEDNDRTNEEEHLWNASMGQFVLEHQLSFPEMYHEPSTRNGLNSFGQFAIRSVYQRQISR